MQLTHSFPAPCLALSFIAVPLAAARCPCALWQPALRVWPREHPAPRLTRYLHLPPGHSTRALPALVCRPLLTRTGRAARPARREEAYWELEERKEDATNRIIPDEWQPQQSEAEMLLAEQQAEDLEGQLVFGERVTEDDRNDNRKCGPPPRPAPSRRCTHAAAAKLTWDAAGRGTGSWRRGCT